MSSALATSVVMALFLLVTSVVFLFLISAWTNNSLETALEMAQDTVGRSPQISVFHLPPVFMIDME